jgi:hypothetical protein
MIGDALILDLTRLPRRLGFFEQQPDSSNVDRYALEFLHSFVKSLRERNLSLTIAPNGG